MPFGLYMCGGYTASPLNKIADKRKNHLLRDKCAYKPVPPAAAVNVFQCPVHSHSK